MQCFNNSTQINALIVQHLSQIVHYMVYYLAYNALLDALSPMFEQYNPN